MATPHVAGVVAQIRELQPSLLASEIETLLECIATRGEIFVPSALALTTANRLLKGGDALTEDIWDCKSSPPPPVRNA